MSESQELTDLSQAILMDKHLPDPSVDKLSQLEQDIERFELSVIANAEGNIENNDKSCSSPSLIDKSEEIEKIVTEWTTKIIKRYKDLETEDAKKLILEVIQLTEYNDTVNVSLLDTINGKLYQIFATLETEAVKETIFNECFDKCCNTESKADKTGQPKINDSTNENKSFLEFIVSAVSVESKNKYESLSSIQKRELQFYYKKLEFLVFQELCGLSENEQHDINKIVDKKSAEHNSQIKNDPKMFSCTKISHIIEKLDYLDYRFNVDLSNYRLMIERLESFLSDSNISSYEKLLADMDSYLNKQMDIAIETDAFEQSSTEFLKSVLEVSFCQRYEISSNCTEGMVNILKQIHLEDTVDNRSLEEVKFHFENMVDCGKIESQDLYRKITEISQENINGEKKLDILFAYLLNTADIMESFKIAEKMAGSLSHQDEKKAHIAAVKIDIIKNVNYYCGLLDRYSKESYTSAIRLYLDKLDRLIAEHYAEDLSYGKRKETFDYLNAEINEIAQNSKMSEADKKLIMEQAISVAISQLVYSSNVDLSSDISDHLDYVVETLSKTEHQYKRNSLTKNNIDIDNFFHNSGQIRVETKKEIITKNMTVVAKCNGLTDYYRLTDDLDSLLKNYSKYCQSIEEFEAELRSKYMELKLFEFKKAISEYNGNKNTETLIGLTKGLVYYFSYQGKHLQPEEEEMGSIIKKFVETYHNTMKYLLVPNEKDQEILTELESAIDSFSQDIAQYNAKSKNSYNYQTLSESLKSLKSTLRHKCFKNSSYSKLYIEDRIAFSGQLELNNFLHNKLNIFMEKSIPEIIWLRTIFHRGPSSEGFFDKLNLKLDELSPENINKTSKESVECIHEFIQDEKYSMILGQNVSDNSKIDDFVTKLTTGKITLSDIFSDKNVTSENRFRALSIIIQENNKQISKENLEQLIFLFDINKNKSICMMEFVTNIMKLYANKLLIEKISNLGEEIYKAVDRKRMECIKIQLKELDVSLVNAFNVWEIVSSQCDRNFPTLFLEYLKKLSNSIPYKEMEIHSKQSPLEQQKINFIVNILNSENKLAVINTTNIFSLLDTVPNSQSSILTYLQLLLQLPHSFYSDRKSYKSFVKTLLPKLSIDDSDFQKKLYWLVRAIVARYYGIFLDVMFSDEQKYIKLNSKEAVERLLKNIKILDFVDVVPKLLDSEETAEKENFVLATCAHLKTEKIDNAIQFLYTGEKKVLLEILRHKSNLSADKVSELKKNKLSIDTMLKETCQFIVKNDLDKIFNFEGSVPITMWGEELLALRVDYIINLMLDNFKNTEDHGTTLLSDVIHAFVNFHRINSNVNGALKTLDLVYNNIKKFRSLEEIKETILFLVNVEDLQPSKNIIRRSDNRSIPLELMFSQMDAGENKMVANALSKLKIILSHCKFAEISYFTRLFILQTKEEHSYHDLPSIIEQIIESRAYLDIRFLNDHNDKNLSQWKHSLEKCKILKELNLTMFTFGIAKTKDKTAKLLLQIKEEKGDDFYKTLFNKIKSLSLSDKKQPNILNKLNIFLRKIICKSFSNDAIKLLKEKLTDWDGIMFSSNKFKDAELSMQELFELMQDEGKTDQNGINEAIKICIANEGTNGSGSKIGKILHEARNLEKKSVINTNNTNNISHWQKAEIKEWAEQFSKSHSLHQKIFCWSTRSCNKTLCEVLSVIIRAVILYDHYETGPRVVQLMALLLFLDCKGKGRLGNIYTGEGKTLIIAMLATCLGMTGKKVDIVTSSKVLAVRDSKPRDLFSKEGYKGFYEMFCLRASNNCDEICEDRLTGEEERKKRYKTCNIIYGETGYFQRDILLSSFFRKDIRTERNGIGDVLILDEVDSMMIDNAAKTLYISHNITDMKYLRDVFIHIWAAVNSRTERHYSKKNVQKILKYITQLINNQQRELNILVPLTLIDFVQKNLKIWIESAYDAKCMVENDAYIIGDVESQRHNEVIIMDKDTGVEQTSTKWSSGLHQFIQLKHNCKLSDESLKAVYISNLGYFQMYPKLYGMTGTVGGKEERSLLRTVYGIDFFELPRFKEYRFEYDFDSESIAQTKEEWAENILVNIEDNMNQNLKITADYIEMMKKKYEVHNEQLLALRSSEKNYSDQKINLDRKTATSKCKIKICTTIELIRDEIYRFCDKPVFETLKQITDKMKEKIASAVATCEENKLYGGSIEGSKFEFLTLYQKFSEELTTCQTTYDIEKFLKCFKSGICDVANFKNQEKFNLDVLNAELSTVKEEIGYIKDSLIKCCNDLTFYEEASKVKEGDIQPNSQRAVLIICENIDDLTYIETKVRNQSKVENENKFGRNRIYTYDRAYKKFSVSKLEAGDIVIATNIAGRGTDLEITAQVEENGGLHVILTYMPKNLRIEKQAFGRTARAGNKGTGTFIVLDEKQRYGELVEMSQLKNERNEEEEKRLAIVEKEQLPKIKLEDELFIEFNKLQQNMENILINQDNFKLETKCVQDEYLKLQMESLKNNWAIWLNKMSDQFRKVHETGNVEIYNQFKDFQNVIIEKLSNNYKMIEEPGELNKLGRLYLDNCQYSKALECFEHIIKNHLSFSSIAHYYTAFCIIRKNGGGFESKLNAKAALQKSLIMLEAERAKVLSRNQILKTINEIARTKGKGLRSNCFGKQNEGEAHILSKHINAIYSAIGSEITPDHFNAPGISGDQPQKVFDELKQEKYNIIKQFRISKKCVIGCKVLNKDSEKHKEALKDVSLENRDEVEQYLNAEYVNCNEMASSIGKDIYTNTIKILTDAKIISEPNIYKKKSSNEAVITHENLIVFPDKFPYCKNDVLNYFTLALAESEKYHFWHSKRKVEPSSFQNFMYTENTFLKDANGLIEKKTIVRIAKDINKRLLGNLDHAVFCCKGKELKKFFKNKFIRINPKHLQEVVENPIEVGDFTFCETEIEHIKNLCLRLGKHPFSINPIGNNVFFKNDLADSLKEIIDAGSPTCNENKLNALLTYLKLDNETNVLSKHDLIKTLAHRISLQEDEVNKILTHLEFYTYVFVDHASIKKKFATTKNDLIFLGKKNEIKHFCTGLKKISLRNGNFVEMIDNESVAKNDVVDALKRIVNLSDDDSSQSAEHTSFQALLIHLGFDSGHSFAALDSFTQYSLKDSSHLLKITEYLQTINVKDITPEIIDKIKKLDFSIDSRLGTKTTDIINTLKHFSNKPLKKEDFTFEVNEESFDILRALLLDANIITPSIIALLKGESTSNNNMELENLFIKICQCEGVVTDKDLIFQNEETSSTELFRRLVDLKVIKPPRINFALAKATYVPNFVGGNLWKNSNDPLKRIEDIKKEIENVVRKVFSKTDSKSKDLDEKVKTIANIVEKVSGSFRYLPEVKVEMKDLRSMFGDGTAPPELMDFIHMSFDGVLDYKDDKWFDWDCLLCGFLGIAQIAAGVALEILSGGSAHFLAQMLISEGVGDILFAIQAGIEGNFSWQSYGQHKVQSLILSLVTCGVGSYLSKGAQVAKLGTALATKTAITKAVLKSVCFEACTAFTSALVNVGTEEISKVIMDEMANVHFIQYFENWTKNNKAYELKRITVEKKLLDLYDKFGVSIVEKNVKVCINTSLNQVMSGTKIFDLVSQAVSSVTKGFSMAAKRLGNCNSKAKVLGQIVSIVGKAVKVATFSKNFENLCFVCNDYYDHLYKELEKLDRNLSEQQKQGNLNINEEQVAKNKATISFSGEAKQHLAQADVNMHEALIMKVKNGFLQPAVSSLLNIAIKPMQKIISAPVANAMKDLENHIDERAAKFLYEHIRQDEGKIPSITAKQKKALELRNDIINVDEITVESLLKAELVNFPGQTLESIREAHGPNLHAFVRDGKIFPILPTYKQVCKNLEKGSLKCVGNLQIKMAASHEMKGIDIVSVDIEGSNVIIHHEKGPRHVDPVGESIPGGKGYKIAFIDGVNGEKGHYCPVVQDEQGNYKVIRTISQNSKTEDGCFAQCMLYLKEYEKTKDLEKARECSEKPENVGNYYESMGKSAKYNTNLQKEYLHGITVNSKRIIGGLARKTKNNLNRMERNETNVTNEANDSDHIIVKAKTEEFFYDNMECEEIVTKQIVLVPFSSIGTNEPIKVFTRMSRFNRTKYGRYQHVRSHFISARAGGKGSITNLFPCSPGMNSKAYHGFEKSYLKILQNNRNKTGYLIFKHQVVFDDPNNMISLAKKWHVSIGTTNADVQLELNEMFTDRRHRDLFCPDRRSGRIDYKTVIIDRGNTETAIQEPDDIVNSESDMQSYF